MIICSRWGIVSCAQTAKVQYPESMLNLTTLVNLSVLV